MKITKKSIFLGLIIIAVLYMVINTFFLVKDFKANLKENKQEPTASNIEVGQIDENTKRIWKVLAQESTADSHLSDIEASQVKAILYNNQEQDKIIIKADSASFSEDKSSCDLTGNINIDFIESKIIMKTSALPLNSKREIKINQPVEFISKTNTNKKLKARSALITDGLGYLTLYNIYNSPIAQGVILDGGQARFAIKNMSLNKQINITHGVKITGNNISITASNLKVLMSNNKPARAVFTGRPKAVQNNKILRADTIEYIFATKQIKAKGNIKTN